MTLNETLTKFEYKFRGRIATEAESDYLRSSILGSLLPTWFLDVILSYKLIGSRLSITQHADQSSIGVEMLWLTPEQMISEANDVEPGLTVCSNGFLPIGICASGSGDPYFLDFRDIESTDPAVIRIRHDLAGEGAYPPVGLELVAHSLSSFFLVAD